MNSVKDPCPMCGQNIAKRKVVFNKILVSAAAKFYQQAMLMHQATVKIKQIILTNAEYARANDLVRSGLLYKGETMEDGEYGVPTARIKDFLDGNYRVSAYFLTDPTSNRIELSELRIRVDNVRGVQELMAELGPKLTEYVPSEYSTLIHHHISNTVHSI